MKKAEYQRIRLKVMVFRTWLRRFKNIPNSTDSWNHFRGEVFVDLVSQPTNQHIHDIRLRIETIVPNVFQDHRFRDHAPGIAHEIFEQSKFACLKIQLLASANNLS